MHDQKTTKFRKGVKQSLYAMTPLLLEQKKPKQNNVLVGDDAAQVRFVEQHLSDIFECKITCQTMPLLMDSDLIGKEQPLLYRVDRPSQLDLSPNIKTQTAFWALDSIDKGTVGVSAIVRYAAKMLDLTLKREQVDKIANELTKQPVDDVRVAIWDAVYLLTGPEPKPFKRWPRPWDNYLTWMPKDEDPRYRLNALYQELRDYTFVRDNDEEALKKMGRFKPSAIKELKNLKLSLTACMETLEELSVWRTLKTDPYVSALRISKIWQKQ